MPSKGKTDLAGVLDRFHLNVGSFLRVLRSTRSIVTGVQVALLMASHLLGEQRGVPGALTLEVLCHGREARLALQAMLEMAGYRMTHQRCCHNVGEWLRVPEAKRDCMVQGELMQRAVHIIELPRPPLATVLGRTYGSMAGNYITGGGKAVSLFPHLTFVDREVWLPACESGKVRMLVQHRYPGWRLRRPGEPSVEEVASPRRVAPDSMTRSLMYDRQTGAFDATATQARCVNVGFVRVLVEHRLTA